MHLFASITPRSACILGRRLPDPPTSPAHYYATDLFVDYDRVAIAAETEVSGWAKGFSRLEHFCLMGDLELLTNRSTVSFIPLHGLSTSLNPHASISSPFHPRKCSTSSVRSLLRLLGGTHRRPVFKSAHVQWFHGAFSGGGDETYRQLVVIPTWWHPLPETRFSMASRGRSFVDNGFGGGVFLHPGIPRKRPLYVHSVYMSAQLI